MYKPTTRHYLLLSLSQTMVAIGIVCSKYLLTHLPLFVILELRFAIATLILDNVGRFVYRGHNMRHARIRSRDWLVITAKALCAGFLFNGLMLLGLRYANASVAGIITSTLPAVVALLSFFILKEVLSLEKWLCIAFAVLGIAVINLFSATHGTNSNSLIGGLFILLSLLPEAMYYILVKRFHTRVPGILLATIINGINALAFLPFALYQLSHTSQIHLTPLMLGILIISGSASSLFYLFWYFGSKNVPASLASFFTAVMPISTIIIAWLFLAESLHLMQLIGMLFIIGSIGLGTRRKKSA